MSTPSQDEQKFNPEAIALLYHELRQETTNYSYVLSPGRFQDHLRLLGSLPAGAYKPIITFDDGHASDYSLAFPLLESFHAKAHFFITAGWIGKRTEYMTPQHLQALQVAGHTIGAHGWSHALLTQCNAKELKHELTDARSALEDILSAPVVSMSLPGGRSNASVLRACWESGYTTVWTSAPGAVRAGEKTPGRFNILASHSDQFLNQLFDPASGKLKQSARAGKWKASVQKLLGDRLYARLWAMLNHEEPDAAQAVLQDQVR